MDFEKFKIFRSGSIAYFLDGRSPLKRGEGEKSQGFRSNPMRFGFSSCPIQNAQAIESLHLVVASCRELAIF